MIAFPLELITPSVMMITQPKQPYRLFRFSEDSPFLCKLFVFLLLQLPSLFLLSPLFDFIKICQQEREFLWARLFDLRCWCTTAFFNVTVLNYRNLPNIISIFFAFGKHSKVRVQNIHGVKVIQKILHE